MPTSTPPNEDSIRAIAYGLWLAEGRPEGRADAHWRKAYELVTSEPIPPLTVKKAAAAPAKKAAATPVKKSTGRKATSTT